MTELDEILDLCRKLPPEAQPEVLELARRLAVEEAPRSPLRSLRGLWAGHGFDISAEEIDAARREMWGGSRSMPGDIASGLIVRDPAICGGAYIFDGTRVPVRTVLACLADGDTIEQIRVAFPTLTAEHVRAAIAFAAAVALANLDPASESPQS